MKLKAKNIINIIIYSLIILAYSINIYSQEYKSIPKNQIQDKIIELKDNKLNDTLLFSIIGFFRIERIRFSNIVENTMYVNEKGLYYRVDLSDDVGNITISCTFFKPHFNFVPIPIEERDSTYIVLMNEHICVCESVIGYPTIRREGNQFICGPKNLTDEEAENYSINCYDLKNLEYLISNFFQKGYEIKNKIQIKKELEILELNE